MIYKIDGTQLSSAYDIDDQPLLSAYDIDGNIVYQSISSLKICTYNVGGWYIGSGTNVPSAQDSAFYDLQNGIVSSIDADILCIEEYWTNFSSTRTALSLLEQYYPYIHTEDGSTQYMGRAVCSKYPITNYQKNYFSVEASRYYDDATVNVNGLVFHVLVTHLSANNSSNRVLQAQELFNYVQNKSYEKYLIFGDFNSTLYNPLSDYNKLIYEQFLYVGCTMANAGAFGVLNTACNNADWSQSAFAIDNIIASSGFTFDSVNTNDDKLTNAAVLSAGKIDHIPLYSTISIN